jgi:uncharacterized protein (TIGR04551 family)
MRSSPRLLHSSLVSIAVAAVSFTSVQFAAAQMRPGGPMPQPGQPGQPGIPDGKPDGVAEKAPTPPGALPTTPVLPPPVTARTRFELLELDGYFRFRTHWMKNFHLGFDDDVTLGGAPFRRPLGCRPGGAPNKPCSSSLKSSNLRLRLEPRINLSETMSVHMQIDVLDNLVLGSTPDGTFLDGSPPPTNIPVSAFAGKQVPPEAGVNAPYTSVRAKRAWAEVMTSLGLLKFGRQPSHWGLGMLANSGDADPFQGTYDIDNDFGDTVDRLMFATMIPGTGLRAAIATDWTATRPSSAQTDIWRNRYDGQPWNLDHNVDVNQWVFVVARLDSPEEFRTRTDRGELAFNYGTYFVYRTQDWDFNPSDLRLGGAPAATAFVPRDAKAYIPDIFLRLGWRKLLFEFEGAAIIGSIDELTDVGVPEPIKVRQYGAIGRLTYRAARDKLRLGFEVGYASGDQWDNSPQGSTNVRDARALPGDGDNVASAFRFNMAYNIDLILFRELLGTVTNATYLRPSLAYDLTDSISFRAQTVASFANVPVSTPGNGRMWGVELDGDLGYHTKSFFAGISYGVLFPLGAMHHPEDEMGQGGPGFGYGTNTGKAGTAQTIRTRMVLRF